MNILFVIFTTLTSFANPGETSWCNRAELNAAKKKCRSSYVKACYRRSSRKIDNGRILFNQAGRKHYCNYLNCEGKTFDTRIRVCLY